MKKLVAIILGLCLSLAACGAPPASPEPESSLASMSSVPTPDTPAEPKLVLTGNFITVSFPEGTAISAAPYGHFGLLLELEDRVLICAEDALWWVNTADGSIISRRSFVLDENFYNEFIRAEAWEGDGYDHRVFTVDSVSTVDSNGQKEPLVYTLPGNLSDTLTDFWGRYISFDLSPDGKTLTYTDAQGCWLADADGSNKRLVLANSEINGIMSESYPVEITRPWYWLPRFLNDGKVLASRIHDQVEAEVGAWAVSLIRLETGEVKHYGALPIELDGSFQYFDDIILVNRRYYIDTRDFSDYTRPEQSGLTWDGDYFLNADKWGTDFRVLRRNWEDFETPITLLETKNCRLSFGGMTRTFSLWCVEPLAAGGAPQYLLLPYR